MSKKGASRLAPANPVFQQPVCSVIKSNPGFLIIRSGMTNLHRFTSTKPQIWRPHADRDLTPQSNFIATMALISYLAHLFSSKVFQSTLQPLLTILNFFNSQWNRVGRPLDHRTCLSPYRVEFITRSFHEEKDPFDPDFRTHSISFHLRAPPYSWLCKVTFSDVLPAMATPTLKKKQRQDLEDLCCCIDFREYPPFNNTVTEYLVTRDRGSPKSILQQALQTSSEYEPIASELSIHVQEDPNRVVFPTFTSPPNIQSKDISQIHKIRELQNGVHEVQLDESTYIYKEVDRPMYRPGDSDVLEREFQNLHACRGVHHIVQLIAAVVSSLPYQTVGDGPPVLRGILLEYHPNGSLLDCLRDTSRTQSWTRSALQIAEALSHLHDKDIAHMDLKPGNIVISREGDAILIDISGMAYTYERLSPEMKAEIKADLKSLPLDLRKANDIWALGKIFGEMALVSHSKIEQKLLGELAAQTPHIRLDEIIRALQA